MKPYELNGHKYYGIDSKVFKRYLDWIDERVGIAELLNNLRAAIIMDVDYADIVTFRKNKTTISANYDEYVETLEMIKEKCLEEEWYEECKIVEDLKEIRVRLYVLDFLKDTFERKEISHIEREITEEYDIYFRDLFEEEK
jgi:hypothetical protein|tara:strand:- start:134 stop:556 length:423 start_codon:yes stop_codon:yes gene_type:complete